MWSDQIEQDSEEGGIPDAMEEDDLSTKEEVEEENQGDEGSIAKAQSDSKVVQNTNQISENIVPSVDQVDAVDPGGTKGDATMVRNEVDDTNNAAIIPENDEVRLTGNKVQHALLLSSEIPQYSMKEKGGGTLIPKLVTSDLDT